MDHDELSRDFERFLRHEMPYLLNLSKSKTIAMQRVFYHFSDCFKWVAIKCPNESNNFCDEFKKRIRGVSHWRRPAGHKIIPEISNRRILEFFDGRKRHTRYTLYKKCEL